jgi:parallel beta-helix repeat protein
MKRGILLFVLVVALVNLSIVYAADCGGDVQCQCGDTLVESHVMDYDIMGCPGNAIIIGSSGLTLDCDGHLIDGGSSIGDYAFYIWDKSFVSIKNCEIRRFEDAFYMMGDDNEISSNTVYDLSGLGIHIKPDSNRITISNNDFLSGGIYIYSNGNSNNQIFGNNITNRSDYAGSGIFLRYSSNNSIFDNNIYGNVEGIYIMWSTNNQIFNNNIFSNSNVGLHLRPTSNNNLIYGNTIYDNGAGFSSYDAHGNVIWSNEFFDNTNTNANEADPSNNYWNISEHGNYWDDFESNPGYPNYYEISGPGSGIDWLPNQIEENLISLWHMDEGNGGIIYDSTENNNDGIINGANWIEGRYGSALYFDGIDDRVEIPDSESFLAQYEVTLEAWIKRDSYNNGTIFSKNGPFYLGVKDNKATGSVYAGDYWNDLIFSTTTLVPGVWYHLALTYDGEYVRLYIDGIEEASIPQTGDILMHSHGVYIGWGEPGQDEYFKGIIDEVEINDYAKTEFDVSFDSNVNTDNSYIVLTNGNYNGLTTCPAGDGTEYQYLRVAIRDYENQPLQGISFEEFDFIVSETENTEYYGDLSLTFLPQESETDSNGEIRFKIKGDTSIQGNVSIKVAVEDVLINDQAILETNTFDKNLDGTVNIPDLGMFAVDYQGVNWMSDFNWDGNVDIADLGMFAAHYQHAPGRMKTGDIPKGALKQLRKSPEALGLLGLIPLAWLVKRFV